MRRNPCLNRKTVTSNSIGSVCVPTCSLTCGGITKKRHVTVLILCGGGGGGRGTRDGGCGTRDGGCGTRDGGGGSCRGRGGSGHGSGGRRLGGPTVARVVVAAGRLFVGVREVVRESRPRFVLCTAHYKYYLYMSICLICVGNILFYS